MPQNANFMLRQGQDCLGFCEASSMERLLNEQVLVVQMHASRIAQLGATASDEQSVLDGRKAIDRR